MNKIEAAIKEIKETIKYKKLYKRQIDAEICILDDVLSKLEKIESDKFIPHVEVSKEILNIVSLTPNKSGITNISNHNGIQNTI